MGKKKMYFFMGFSILALVAFFVLASVAGQWGQIDINNNDGLNVPNSAEGTVINKEIKGPDPLITPSLQSFIRETDPMLGSKEATLKIMEFGDFQCPYCADMQTTLAKVLPEFSGQVSFIWKDFANPNHLEAKNSAMAARCAQNQGKFWEYHDYLFENQASLSRELYNKIALELQLNLADFNKCLDGKETVELVGEGLTDGQNIGVDATPYLIIGNSAYNYALSEEELRQAIQNKLGK